MSLATTTLAQLDSLIAEYALLNHPFYQAWNAGTLTPAQLAGYARQYAKHVDNFPQYLALAHGHSADPAVREALRENLNEEEGGPEPHPELWLKFADSLGNDRTLTAAEPTFPESAAADAIFRTLSSAGDLSALSTLYCYEAQIPAIARTKIEGLQAHYADLGAHTGYFHVHEAIDVEHAADARRLLAERIVSPADAAEVLRRGKSALRATNLLLDGVCREYGVACPSMN